MGTQPISSGFERAIQFRRDETHERSIDSVWTVQQQLAIEKIRPILPWLLQTGVDGRDFRQLAQACDEALDLRLEFGDGAIAWSFQQDVQPIEAAEVLEVLMEGPYRRSALREEMQNVRVEGNVSEEPCADAGHHGGSRQQHHPIAEREAQRSAKKPFRHEVG